MEFNTIGGPNGPVRFIGVSISRRTHVGGKEISRTIHWDSRILVKVHTDDLHRVRSMLEGDQSTHLNGYFVPEILTPTGKWVLEGISEPQIGETISLMREVDETANRMNAEKEGASK